MLLEKIAGPADVRKLNPDELEALAGEMRCALMNRLSKRGGHFGPNFGFVEAAIALHYVFDSPRDKIVFDVSHQTYCHKMLTGRAAAYTDEARFDDVSGFTNPDESGHDIFNIGHTSTSLSLAAGLARSRDLAGEDYDVVAVIGDGSLGGGEALEGLCFAGEQEGNFIIVVNDNDMSIAENHGGIYKNLRLLRETGGQAELNIFRAMGLEYEFVADGNDIGALIAAFKKVRGSRRPVAVHIVTQKGKGYAPAEQNREAWHYSAPFDVETGRPKSPRSGESYEQVSAQFLLEKMKADKNVLVIAAGTPTCLGFTAELRAKAGLQFADVGIAEEHAVAMASGAAKNGAKPVFGTYSSFFQRTYDQISQDLCINGSPATLVVNGGSVYGMNDITHLGLFDIPLMSHIPNLVCLAPTSKAEYLAMLDWSIEQNERPVAIRIPGNGVVSDSRVPDADYSRLNKFKVERKGSRVAVIALGGFFQLGEKLCDALESEAKIRATLINPRFFSGLDEELLDSLKKEHQLALTLEDGISEGGFGQTVAAYYGADSMRVRCYGIRKSFPDRYDAARLLEENGISVPQMVADVRKTLSS